MRSSRRRPRLMVVAVSLMVLLALLRPWLQVAAGQRRLLGRQTNRAAVAVTRLGVVEAGPLRLELRSKSLVE